MMLHNTHILSICISFCMLTPGLLFAKGDKEDAEPTPQGSDVIHLISGDTLKGWKSPSNCWSIKDGIISGDTEAKALNAPEWLYTTKRFADFIFTCELRLTGTKKPNSGIYFRVNPIQFKGRKNKESYEAASGYEFDAVSGKHCGSLGDWYARPSLRVFADPAIIARVYKENDWNRMTIRAQGNRLEYWLNGAKIIDYVDKDPKGSREGLIGLQIHDKAVMKVDLRNASILPMKPNQE